MSLSYEYSIGSVRAKEKGLLSKADIESMLVLKDVPSLISFLNDKGYPEGKSVDEIIKNSRRETVEYLYKIVPDESVFNAFIYPFDAHNIKSVIKGLLADANYNSLIMEPNTIKKELIETAVKENKYALLPEEFSQAAEKAYKTLAHTADARLSDAYIDRACMEAQLKAAKASKIDFLFEYVSADMFFKNVKIAIRAALSDAPKEYYEDALCGGIDGFNKKEVISAALKGKDALLEYFGTKDIFKCSAAIEEYKKSSSSFEKFTESYLTLLAVEKCKRSGNTAEPALGYYIAKTEEFKAIQIILTGLETNTETEIIRERLREIYG